MNRRGFLIAAGGFTLSPRLLIAQDQNAQIRMARVAAVERAMAARRSQSKPIPAEWIVGQLGEGMTDRDRRIMGFELVRNIPYRLTTWKGDPDSLFALGRGDCRHKSAALLRLMRVWKFEARAVQVLFDWADLPIPSSIIRVLGETRGVHDTVEVDIDGAMKLVDPTWSLEFRAAGFPVQMAWDGRRPTLSVTLKANAIVRPGDLKQGENIYAHFKLEWPRRENVLAFNRAFNAWSDELSTRAKS